MKKKNILLALSSLLFLFAGCSDDDIVQQPSAVAGQDVEFGVGSTDTPVSRTIYNGNIIEQNGHKYEGVEWLNTDTVSLYCANSANTQLADYSLQLINPANLGEFATGPQARLLKTGVAGLQWGNEAKEHVFYGVYPSPKQYFIESKMEKPVLSGTPAGEVTLKGYIPKVQKSGAVRTTGTSTIVDPCMDYAYMAARTQVPVSQLGNPVSLSFVPFVTSIEMSFVNKTDHPIELTTISVGSLENPAVPDVFKPVYGKFEAKLENMGTTTYPVVTDAPGQSLNRSQVVLSLFNENGVAKPVTLAANGGTLTCTVFLHTTASLNNLVVTLQSGAGFRRGVITGIDIVHNKKNFIHNIPLSSAFDVSNWISYLPDDAIVRQLSIPGAGGIGAPYGTSTEVNELSQEQTLSIEDLWNQGIRAFELSVSRQADNATGEQFGECQVSCNGSFVHLTLKEAVNKILTKLSSNKREFAMLILTYQPMGDYGRNANEFTRQLSDFWKNVETQSASYGIGTALYDPSNATVGASRGKLFCIARPTSANEDAKLNVLPENVHRHILVINGWGSLKDKWQERGYTGNMTYGPGLNADGKPNRPVLSATYLSWTGNIDKNKKVDPFVAEVRSLTPNFYYSVQAGANDVTPKGAWVQEWARVSPGVAAAYTYRESIWDPFNHDSFYWANTLDEKRQRINETFDYAMNRSKGDITYINSLCGYYVDERVQRSVYLYSGSDNIGTLGAGGLSGNVKDYAEDINQYVYNSIFHKGLNGVTGPLGIVLMDRVGNNAATAAANTNLPYLVIANNFSFEMKENTEQTSRSVDAQSAEHYDFIFDASANK